MLETKIETTYFSSIKATNMFVSVRDEYGYEIHFISIRDEGLLVAISMLFVSVRDENFYDSVFISI